MILNICSKRDGLYGQLRCREKNISAWRTGRREKQAVEFHITKL